MLYLIIIFFIFIGLIYIINYLSKIGYPIIFSTKYYYKRYYFKKISFKQREKIIEDLKTIAINSINYIPNYNIFKNKNIEDKIVIIIYDRKTNLPIATNISFYFDYLNQNIIHLGLYLVDKKFQKKGLQAIMFVFGALNFLIENNFGYIFTDLGRSASGFKNLDMNFKCYPSVKNKVDDNFKIYSQNLARYFFNNYAKDNAGVSELATFSSNNNVIKGSNLKDGGGFYKLLEFEKSRQSRNTEYNNFINDNCKNKEDEFIIVGKANLNALKYFLL